jgi:putative transposase
MGVRPMYEIPDGWVARGFVFEVETTTLEQPAQVAQAFGARRYAYNWALGQVKANLDARTADPTVPPLAWDFYELRKAWTTPSTRWRPGGAVRPRKPMRRGSPTW